MYAPYLHLLDRNAISLIKDSNDGKSQVDTNKIAFLNRLRGLDRSKDHVSPLLSIIEGEHGREESIDEKSACQRKESEAIRRFFKSANTDSSYLDSHREEVGATFTNFREAGWQSRESFLIAAAPLISATVKIDQRNRIQDQLIRLAQQNGLMLDDPLLALCLSCLFGNTHARGVLKPSKVNTYNVLNDLHVISRVGLVKATVKQCGANLRVRFVSMDTGLVGVLEQIRISNCLTTSEGELRLQLKYLPSLFPALTDELYLALVSRLQSETPS